MRKKSSSLLPTSRTRTGTGHNAVFAADRVKGSPCLLHRTPAPVASSRREARERMPWKRLPGWEKAYFGTEIDTFVHFRTVPNLGMNQMRQPTRRLSVRSHIQPRTVHAVDQVAIDASDTLAGHVCGTTSCPWNISRHFFVSICGEESVVAFIASHFGGALGS